MARERRDDQVGTQARHLLAWLAEDRFMLAVIGQFSRGKCTLMDAILGARRLIASGSTFVLRRATKS